MLRLIMVVVLMAAAAVYFGSERGGPFGPSRPATIADLHTTPDRWEGAHVRVSGTVGDRLTVLGFGGFVLVDEGGREILVAGLAQPAAPGQPMTVEGQFVTAFTVGTASMSAILVGGG